MSWTGAWHCSRACPPRRVRRHSGPTVTATTTLLSTTLGCTRPSLKRRAKHDRALGLAKILFRIIRRFTAELDPNHNPVQVRDYFSIATRRAVGLLRIVDDAADSFDVRPDGPTPALTFGMGYGEGSEGNALKGNGMLCGYQEDVIQRIMMIRGLDDTLFEELESLARLE